ncbi:uncharacterized protein LOC119737006 [Patiria miniata]|uniref:2-oxo-4-hydroxy-4-carboxy-5-ureidoimidazoline decarboxylase n=1 Tax=Patiria miniata TaxID=46514 RepID=A0A914AU18_PATMI|nr:uncharacterized protein LOC119737006 [Patiria miniata]
MMSSTSDNNMQQVAAHIAHELIEMKSHSSTAEYLKESSAAQAEILQLQVQDNQKPDVIQLVGDYTAPAMHALQDIIGCNSKTFFQAPCTVELNQGHFSQIPPPGLQEARDLHSNSCHGNQDDASGTSNISQVFVIEGPAPHSLGESLQEDQQDCRQQTPDIVSSPETQTMGGHSQTGVMENSALEEVPAVFYVETLHDANDALRNFEKQTGTKYSAYKSTAGFGNTVYQPDRPHKIYFEERSTDLSGLGIPYDGIPFINIGKKVMDCQYGMDRCRAAKKKYMERQLKDVSRQRRPLAQERTKKIQCRAQIRMKEILKYPDFKVPLDSNSRKDKVRLSKELRDALKNGDAKGEKRIYIKLPCLSDHTGHSLGEAVKEVKPCLSGKQAVKELNTLSWDAFIQRFGNVVERGAVVASAAWSKRPFANIKALHAAFCEFMDSLSQSGKEAIFRCYPNLQIASSAHQTLSNNSSSEFQLTKLDIYSPEESALLVQLNTKYRDNFHFSYIVCGRETTQEEVLADLHARTQNSRDAEILRALQEVKKIAWYRILERVRTVTPT